jgi:beta-glucanase (GH16 family)
MNNALPKFPEASEESKFSELELIRLLEYSLPHKWQQKFDYDNYIPTEHDRTRLLRECEAIERNQAKRNADSDKKKKKAKDASTSAKSDKKTKNVESRPEKHCDECGKNFTHNTAQCWKIQKRNKAKVVNSDEKKETKRTFSNKGFRKEVNLLAKEKGNSKRKVLDMYADAIKREKAKLKSKKPNGEATESESEMSIDVVEVLEPKKKKRQVKFDFEAEKKKKKSSEEHTPEEKAFLKKVMAEEANSEQDDSVLSDSTSDA